MKKAIRQRWPVTREMKQAIMSMLRDMINGGDPELAIDAAKVIVVAEGQNQNDKLKRRAKDARIQIQQILQMAEPTAPDPEYLAWKQAKLLEEARRSMITLSEPEAPQEVAPLVPSNGESTALVEKETAPAGPPLALLVQQRRLAPQT